MFRIERRLVNLGTARTLQVDSETGALLEGEDEDLLSSASYVNPVLSAQEILDDAKDKATHIIEEAREETATMILAAKEEAEESRNRAWKEGYSQGVEEGKRSYDEKLSQDMKSNSQSLKRVIKELYDARERIHSKLEKDVVDLSLQIVKKIINPAEEALNGVFEALIKNALKQTASDGKIMLRVSIADYDRFFSTGNAVFELEGGVKVTASVLRDTSLDEYDCIIDAESSTANAGLDTQLRLIELAFTRGH